MMRRFTLYAYGEFGGGMDDEKDGEWVYYDEAQDEIAELKAKLVAKQHDIDAAAKVIVAQRESKADAIREMLVAMKEVSSGVGYGIVIHISDIEEYVNNLEKE